MNTKTIKHGITTWDDKKLTLTDDASLSTVGLPLGYKSYHDAQEGEMYDLLLEAHAVDDERNPWIVFWMRDAIKGHEPELDCYNYDTCDMAYQI
jgi:hypothetical protein